MQKYSLDVIGTHLDIYVDTIEDISLLFASIGKRLQDFEQKYSRFLEGNWLSELNMNRRGKLDIDARNMVEYAIEVAQNTNGYFDPTVGKRLTELGYGNKNNQSVIATKEAIHVSENGDYRDIEIVGDDVILHGDIELEFGGVGKGYLIDMIKSMIDSWYSGGSDLCLQKEMEGNWCRFSPGKGGVRGGYTGYNPSLLDYARENRKELNTPEKYLWSLLRGKKLGYKFHRQKPIGEYIVDFYSPELNLVIEVDGESHIEQLQYDLQRTKTINALGIHVLRFTNKEVMENLEGVSEYVISLIERIKKNKEKNSVTPPNLPFSGEEPKRFLINFGGDMYGRGDWRVGLESPFAADEVIGLIHLVDDFLACSAGTKRKWGSHHHLIDPHTGASATEVVATYIEGKSGISVDSYATALSVMPWNMACEVFQKTPEISGVIVSKEGNIFQKEGSRAEVFE